MRYIPGDIEDRSAYLCLALFLARPDMPRNVLYYLAISPEHFAKVVHYLAQAGLGSIGGGPLGHAFGGAEGFRRIVVEKPYGFDLGGARKLSIVLRETFAERDVFRIDHYLGKEAVQNLLYFRFCNTVFEPLWDRRYIDRVEIDLLETGGIGSRGGYYDKAGAARDMLQNHLLQLLCLIAMDQPADLDPNSIRDAKVRVLKSIPNFTTEEFLARSIRAQYAEGQSPDGTSLPDYLDEPFVAPGSRTETYVALRLAVESWRFSGVPFILRTGKALDRQRSEIRIRFKRLAGDIFAAGYGDLPPNSLAIHLQPDAGFWLSFNAKTAGEARIEPIGLRFSYASSDHAVPRAEGHRPEAYERLLADAIAGDSTLFIRSDEAEEAWRIVDGLERAWEAGEGVPLLRYAAGSPAPELPEPAEPLEAGLAIAGNSCA